MNDAWRLGVEKYAVCFTAEPDRIETLTLATAGDLIEIFRMLQPRNADVFDVADAEVGVQRLFEGKGDRIGVVHEERERQGLADREVEIRMEVVRPDR